MSAHVRTHRHRICVISSAHLSCLSVTLQAAGKCVSSEGTSRASSMLLCALGQALEPQRVQRVSSEGTSRVPHCVSILCARLSSLSGYSVYRQKVPHASHAPHCSAPGSRASAGTACIVRRYLTRLTRLTALRQALEPQRVQRVSSEGTSRVPHCVSILCARLSSLSGYSVYHPRVSPA